MNKFKANAIGTLFWWISISGLAYAFGVTLHPGFWLGFTCLLMFAVLIFYINDAVK